MHVPSVACFNDLRSPFHFVLCYVAYPSVFTYAWALCCRQGIDCSTYWEPSTRHCIPGFGNFEQAMSSLLMA